MATFRQDLLRGGSKASEASSRRQGVQGLAPIDQLYDMLADAMSQHDAPAVAELYARQALFITPDFLTLEGPEAIRDWFAEQFAGAEKLNVRLGLSVTVEERRMQHGMVEDRGTYVLSWHDGMTRIPVRAEKYLAVFRRISVSPWSFCIDTTSILPGSRRIPGPQH